MIKELTLAGMKCFAAPQTVRFAAVNVIAGLNGRGKSTLMQALLLLAQSIGRASGLNYLQVSPREGFVRLGAFADLLSRTKEKAQVLTIGVQTDDDIESSIRLQYKSDPNPQNTTLGCLESFLLDGKEQLEKIGSASGESMERKATMGTTSLKGLRQFHNVKYISADRKGPTDYVAKIDEADEGTLGVHGEMAVNALYRMNEESRRRVTEALSDILKGASLNVERQQEILYPRLDSQDGTPGFRPSNVGFGYSYVLPVLLAAQTCAKDGIMIVENPEAHLHPGAQSRLMDYLIKEAKRRGLQLFVETHSDHVINALRIAVRNATIAPSEAALLFVDRDSHREPCISQIKIDAHGALSDYPDDFMEEWGMQMSQLL